MTKKTIKIKNVRLKNYLSRCTIATKNNHLAILDDICIHAQKLRKLIGCVGTTFDMIIEVTNIRRVKKKI